MNPPKKQLGFALPLVILIVVVLIVAGGAGYYFYKILQEQEQILYIKSGDVWSVTIDGSHQQKLFDLNEDISAFYLSPSNKYIVLSSDPANQLWIATTDGKHMQQIEYKAETQWLPENYSFVQWLIDDRFVLEVGFNYFVVLNINGELQFVADVPPEANSYSVILSPDARKIAYTTGGGGAKREAGEWTCVEPQIISILWMM